MTSMTGVTADAADQQEEQTGSLAASETDDDDEPGHEEFIPYKAHKDVRGKLKAASGELELTKKELADIRAEFDTYAKYKDFLDDLQRDGIKNSDDVRALIAKTNGDNAQGQFEQIKQSASNTYHKAIAEGVDHETAIAAFNITVGRAELDMRKKQLDMRESELRRTSTGTVAQRIKTATDKYPEADPDLLRKLAALPGVDINAEAKELHDKEIARQATYATTKAKQTTTRGAGSREGGTQAQPTLAAPPDALKDKKGAEAFVAAVKAKYKTANAA